MCLCVCVFMISSDNATATASLQNCSLLLFQQDSVELFRKHAEASVCAVTRWGDGVDLPGQQACETDRLETHQSAVLGSQVLPWPRPSMLPTFLATRLLKAGMVGYIFCFCFFFIYFFYFLTFPARHWMFSSDVVCCCVRLVCQAGHAYSKMGRMTVKKKYRKSYLSTPPRFRRPGGTWWQPTVGFMIHFMCRLTAENRDQLQNPTLSNRLWAAFLPRTHQLMCVCIIQ